MSLDRLRTMLSAPAGGGDSVDWEAAEAALGRRLPSDYREFIAVYGAGSISDHLGVAIPVSTSGPGEPPIDVVEETGEARFTFARVRSGLPADVTDESALLGWGHSDSADTLCWITTDPDPDNWPVAVWSDFEQQWLVFKVGMVDFLIGLLAGEFDECPLSDLSLWGRPSQRYLSWREA
ncbi:SMI1/KNR4 family protein [Kitasatospora azatica]|uniref:SMI1/KNR4 family protein n=1 Tax=Kitasatospora azatica TaxID=58347 RepID=UPI00068B8C7A|nr:SMI1/KNR4 family protein [Kitasatospora azatica]